MDMNLVLLLVLVVLLVFMFFSSRRRQQKLKEEQARKAEMMVPGARIMSRAGVFGTLVAFDKDDLSKPAEIEIAPGVVVEMHTQAIDLAPEEAPADVVADETADDTDLADETAVDERVDGAYTAETDELPGDDKKD